MVIILTSNNSAVYLAQFLNRYLCFLKDRVLEIHSDSNESFPSNVKEYWTHLHLISCAYCDKKCKLKFNCTELLLARPFNSNCYTLSILKQTKALYRGVQILHNSRIHLTIIVAGKMSWSSFHTKNPQILGTNWRQVFLYPCWSNIIIFSNRVFWHIVFSLSDTECFTSTIFQQLFKLN